MDQIDAQKFDICHDIQSEHDISSLTIENVEGTPPSSSKSDIVESDSDSTIVRKNPGIAFFFSILFPGLGQLYNEHYFKFILFVLADIVGISVLHSIWIYFILWLLGIYDAYTTADKIVSRQGPSRSPSSRHRRPVHKINSGKIHSKQLTSRIIGIFLVLVGFIALAAIFSYVILGAGFFTTHRQTKVLPYSQVPTTHVPTTQVPATQIPTTSSGAGGSCKPGYYVYDTSAGHCCPIGYPYYYNNLCYEYPQIKIQLDGFIAKIKPFENLFQGLGLSSSLNLGVYLLYRQDGEYLVITNTNLNEDFTVGTVKGNYYSWNFPSINIPASLKPKGLIMADDISIPDPITAHVQDIKNDPSAYAFKRVRIPGIYLVSPTRVNLNNEYFMQTQFGIGLMGDEFPTRKRSYLIETFSTGVTSLQIRDANVVGVVLYPTSEIRDQFNYYDLPKFEIGDQWSEPTLYVEYPESIPLQNVKINDLISNPNQYDGKIIKISGIALGAIIPISDVLESELPVDANILGVAVSDKPAAGSQIALAGLNNEILSGSQAISGCYEFDIAVTIKNINGIETPMYFLIDKQTLSDDRCETPVISTTSPSLPTLSVYPTPSFSF